MALAVGAQKEGRERAVVGAVAGGDGEASHQLAVDALGAVGPALGGSEQVAEPQVGGPARLGSSFGVELGRGDDEGRTDRGQVAGELKKYTKTPVISLPKTNGEVIEPVEIAEGIRRNPG